VARFWHAMVKRAVPAALICLALLAPASAASAKPPAKALLVACERGTDITERAGVFEGEMRTVPGAARMQMRFKLQVRTPERDRWTAVAAPGFGGWLTSATGTSRYVYTRRVENLVAPAAYRVQIRFRWLDADGDTIQRARSSSRRCRQPDPRPNLVVREIGVEPGSTAVRRSYVVLVRNSGRTEAGASSLGLSVDGRALPATPVPALAPGEYTLVTVDGPACAAGAPLLAAADQGEAVDERDEDDNRFSRACPSGAASR
jgi:CARDB protein